MPSSRPADYFAGEGSFAGQLLKIRQGTETGKRSTLGDPKKGKKKSKKKDENTEAIRKKREERKRKERVKKAKTLRDKITMRGTS